MARDRKKVKFGPKAQLVMKEFSEGKLKDPQGKKVTDVAQARAIAISEQERVKKKVSHYKTD